MDFDILNGLTIIHITGCDHGSSELTFFTQEGRVFQQSHYQDCCESVLVEDIIGDVSDLIGSPILRAEERSNRLQNGDYGDVEEWTFYELATINGSVTIRWIGTSNGYYSTSVSFVEIDK